MANHPKSIAIFSKNWAEIIGVIDEKFDTIELITLVKLGEKPSRCLFICGRIEAHVKDFVRLWINRAVQPELLAVEADHLFVDRELILGNGRYRL
ncbi:hypothetical protein DM2_2239 [Halorubrum sp. DM2]|nr:hypothetical protein DM2_2239 [Halorubrum sp. DM2]